MSDIFRVLQLGAAVGVLRFFCFVSVFIILRLAVRRCLGPPRRRQPEGERLCVVVTGAASGIGKSVVTELLRRASGRDPDLFVVGIDLHDAGINDSHYLGCVADVTDPAALRAVAAEMRERGLRCDALFPSAGIITVGPLVELDPRRVKAVMDVNVYGAW
jgi:NADP-dependent 3-hydroxy acid dehydrogenase YdfG